ncbi:MAG: hypothetical protein AAGF85_15265 [Bacteroidota bacterium]
MKAFISLLCLLVFFSCKKFGPEKTEEQNIVTQEDQESLSEILSVDEEVDSTVSEDQHQSVDPQQEISDVVQVDLNGIQQELSDDCGIANHLRKEIIVYLKGSSEGVLQQKFITHLKDNADQNIDCFFPRDNDELLLLYKFTNTLVKESSNEQRAIEIILNLDKHMSRAVEYAEHMHDVIPQVALKNTLGFIQEVHKLSGQDRAAILENLEYLESLEAVEKLRSNLLEIKGSQYLATVNEANQAIDEIFKE